MVSRLFPAGLTPAIMLSCMYLVLASGSSFAQKQSPGSSAPVPAPPPLLLGAAWYPEQWPESRWNADLDLMQKAHMHLVRIGEFSWSKLEPEEGVYDLDWMERAINLAEVVKLAAGGLQELKCDGKAVVTLSTPSDVVLLRDVHGTYSGIVRGDATVTVQ
jgi:hypothetical protein